MADTSRALLPWSSAAGLGRLCRVSGRSWRWAAQCHEATPSAPWCASPAAPTVSWWAATEQSGGPQQQSHHWLTESRHSPNGSGRNQVLRGFSNNKKTGDSRAEKKTEVRERTPWSIDIPSCKAAYQSIGSQPLIIFTGKHSDR